MALVRLRFERAVVADAGALARVSQRACENDIHFPCLDVRHDAFIVPDVEIEPEKVSLVMICKAAPAQREDYYYVRGEPLFEQTTVQAFNDAGADVASIEDIVDLGVYLTTAVKCAKTDSRIKAATIKALNTIARRAGEGRVIPAGSTYKIRGQRYTFRGRRVFPSCLQAGPSFSIERSKREMIAEDIAAALDLLSRRPWPGERASGAKEGRGTT